MEGSREGETQTAEAPSPSPIISASTRTAPGLGDDAPLPVDVEQLRPAYLKLMTEYAAVLGESQQFARSPAQSDSELREQSGFTHISGWRPYLVRVLAGAHVRKQLRALESRFAQLEAATDPKLSILRDWLTEARESTQSASSLLPSLRRPSAFILVPFAAGLVATGDKITGAFPWGGWVLPSVALGMLPVALMAFLDLRLAFGRKRELFLPGATDLDTKPEDEQRAHPGRNIYRDEDELFALLGTGKSPEGQIDRVAVGLVLALGAQLLLLLGIALGLDPFSGILQLVGSGILLVVGLALFLLYFVWMAKSARNRVWK